MVAALRPAKGTTGEALGRSSVEMVRHCGRQYDAQLKAAVEIPKVANVVADCHV